MTHTRQYAEHEGELSKGEALPDIKCRRCKQMGAVTYQTWESSCGGYEDSKYTCGACGHFWWVDGPDS